MSDPHSSSTQPPEPSATASDSLPRLALVGAQMLFVAFGALVLVPLLTGLDPNVAMFTAGIGTLVFHFTTRMTVPVFLASSFAFIAPIQGSIAHFGVSATLGGLIGGGPGVRGDLAGGASEGDRLASSVAAAGGGRARHHGDRPCSGARSGQYGDR